MKTENGHVTAHGFPVLDGQLHIGGIALDRLAARVGRTPFYAYDRGLIAQRLASLRNAVPDRCRIHYSIKANPMPALACFLAPLADGFDVASAAELRIALDAGMPAQHISFSGPGKSEDELRQAIASGILINAESEREIGLIARLQEASGWPARLAIRVNPDFEIKSSGMRMGGGAKQFGIDAEEVPRIIGTLKGQGLTLEGLQVYGASQNLRGDLIAQALGRSYALACRLAACSPAPLRRLNLGGGFGIPYFPGEQALDLAPISAALAEISAQAATALAQAQINLELGRYIVGEAGLYVARIVDKKLSRGQVFLVADGGMNHHLAASGNLGQVIRRNYPVAIASRMNQAAAAGATTVVGPLCTPLDTLADRVFLPEAEIGDLVAVFQSGAYGASASPTAFLGHPAPLEVLI